jgi:hypothetical protein
VIWRARRRSGHKARRIAAEYRQVAGAVASEKLTVGGVLNAETIPKSICLTLLKGGVGAMLPAFP